MSLAECEITAHAAAEDVPGKHYQCTQAADQIQEGFL